MGEAEIDLHHRAHQRHDDARDDPADKGERTVQEAGRGWRRLGAAGTAVAALREKDGRRRAGRRKDGRLKEGSFMISPQRPLDGTTGPKKLPMPRISPSTGLAAGGGGAARVGGSAAVTPEAGAGRGAAPPATGRGADVPGAACGFGAATGAEAGRRAEVAGRTAAPHCCPPWRR